MSVAHLFVKFFSENKDSFFKKKSDFENWHFHPTPTQQFQPLQRQDVDFLLFKRGKY